MAAALWILLGIAWIHQVIHLARPIRPDELPAGELSTRARRRLGWDADTDRRPLLRLVPSTTKPSRLRHQPRRARRLRAA